MLKAFVPANRFLRQALWGLAVFTLLSVIVVAMNGRERYGNGARFRRELAQIAWQYGLRSPEVDAALQQAKGSSNAPELIALLDPITGKAAAALPADAVGKSPEEMVPSSGVKLPSLLTLLNHRSIRLRPPDWAQPSRLVRGEWNRVTVSIAPLSPWGEEHPGNERHRYSMAPGAPPTPINDERREHGEHHRSDFTDPPIAYVLMVSAPSAFSSFELATRVVAALGAMGLLLYWLSLAWWTFQDVPEGGYRAFAWGLLVLFTNAVGVAIYLIARKEWKACPSCGQAVERRYRFCHACGHVLKPTCGKCGQSLRREWEYCVDCGTGRDIADKAEA